MKAQILCPVCGSESLTPGTHDLGLTSGDRKFLVSGLEHYDCATCGADPAFPDQIRRNDLKIADGKRRADGLLTGAEIREIREDLGLSQADAAALFGGGANAFSKYERGQVVQSVPMDRLLRVVRAYPFTTAVLRTECTEVGAYSGATSRGVPLLYFKQEGGWKGASSKVESSVTTLTLAS